MQGFVENIDDNIGVLRLRDKFTNPLDCNIGETTKFRRDVLGDSKKNSFLPVPEFTLEQVRMDQPGKPGLRISKMIRALAQAPLWISDEPVDYLLVRVGQASECVICDCGFHAGRVYVFWLDGQAEN